MDKYLAIFALLFVFSCEQQQFSVSSKNEYPELEIKPTYEEWDNLFLWGLAPGPKKHDAIKICAGKDVEMVGTKRSGIQGFLQIITYGIYTPRTYQVQCGEK